MNERGERQALGRGKARPTARPQAPHPCSLCCRCQPSHPAPRQGAAGRRPPLYARRPPDGNDRARPRGGVRHAADGSAARPLLTPATALAPLGHRPSARAASDGLCQAPRSGNHNWVHIDKTAAPPSQQGVGCPPPPPLPLPERMSSTCRPPACRGCRARASRARPPLRVRRGRGGGARRGTPIRERRAFSRVFSHWARCGPAPLAWREPLSPRLGS
jgi:hypothetical protein